MHCACSCFAWSCRKWSGWVAPEREALCGCVERWWKEKSRIICTPKFFHARRLILFLFQFAHFEVRPTHTETRKSMRNKRITGSLFFPEILAFPVRDPNIRKFLNKKNQFKFYIFFKTTRNTDFNRITQNMLILKLESTLIWMTEQNQTCTESSE